MPILSSTGPSRAYGVPGARGLCFDEEPELFFPIGKTGPALLQIEEAKAVCRACPVLEQCREWALSTPEDHGVWGGMSEDERRAELRRRARQARRAGGAGVAA